MIGVFISSISVIVDGVNNFADSGSSVITLIGFKLSSAPADKEHPYGHGRIEYVAAMLVSFIVILVGLQFTKSSIERIINPQPIQFEKFTFITLCLSVLVKVWLSRFNKNLGDLIDSSALKASATDALGDVLITSVVAVSIFADQFLEFPIDGVIGVLVSLFIIYAGVNLVKETVNPLIGEAASSEVLESIYSLVLSYDHILGAHDLVLHSYGSNRNMATIDVEIPCNIDIVAIHDIIDDIEKDIESTFGISIVIHMDPVGFETEEENQIRNEVLKILKTLKSFRSIHDFKITGNNLRRLIEMHVVLDGESLDNNLPIETCKFNMENLVKEYIGYIDCKIIIDIEY
jgi:cation diffusion facilitator family transporter